MTQELDVSSWTTAPLSRAAMQVAVRPLRTVSGVAACPDMSVGHVVMT